MILKNMYFNSIHVDLRCGLLESSKMYAHFLCAVWIQEVHSMSRGKSEQLRSRSEARRLKPCPQESEQAIAEISEYTIFCGENWMINTLVKAYDKNSF